MQYIKMTLPKTKTKTKTKTNRALGKMNRKVGRYDCDPTSFSCAVIFDVFSCVTEHVWHSQDSDDGDPHGQSSISQQTPQPQKTQIQLQSLLKIQSQTQLQPQIQLQQLQSPTQKNVKSNINTIYSKHFEQIFQFAITIINFKFSILLFQFMQQILMGYPDIVALIFGIILTMSLDPVQVLIQARLRPKFLIIISEVLISYWLHIWLNNTEFIGLVQLAIFNCFVFCLFVLNVILFFSERITILDLLFLFLFGNVCFKVWYFLNSWNGNKEFVIRINRKRRITIGNLVRGVKDR